MRSNECDDLGTFIEETLFMFNVLIRLLKIGKSPLRNQKMLHTNALKQLTIICHLATL